MTTKIFICILLSVFTVACSKYPDYASAGPNRNNVGGCLCAPYWWINAKAGNGISSNYDPNSFVFAGYRGDLPPTDCPPNILGATLCCIKAYPKDNDPDHPDLRTIIDSRYYYP